MHTSRTLWTLKRFSALAALLLLMLACSLPLGRTTPPAPTEPPAPPAAPAAPAAPATPTDTAVPPTEAAPVPDISYQGVSFSWEDGVTASARPETLPAAAGADLPPWEQTPEMIQFTLEGYALSGQFHTPAVRIYPIEAYAQMNEYIPEMVANLTAVLNTQPASPEAIPSLPLWNAGQMMQAKVRYLNFQNGRGVAFLTQYGQSFWPINNESLFYMFQGLTNDGRFWVSAVLPVNHPSLPVNGDAVGITDWDAFAEGFTNYVASTEEALAAQDDASFTPSLAALNAMLESIQVSR